MDVCTLKLDAAMGALDWRKIGPRELMYLIAHWDGDKRTFVGIMCRVEDLGVTDQVLMEHLPDACWTKPSPTPAAYKVRISRLRLGILPDHATARNILWAVGLLMFDRLLAPLARQPLEAEPHAAAA